MSERIFNILLVEDDEIDIENVNRAFEKASIKNPLFIARDGVEGLAMLEKGIPNPIVVLLDIKMPRMNGLEFLKIIRSSSKWNQLPVVILTSSREEKDLVETYNLNVAGYIVKPIIFGEFVDILGKVSSYWSLCEFPRKL